MCLVNAVLKIRRPEAALYTFSKGLGLLCTLEQAHQRPYILPRIYHFGDKMLPWSHPPLPHLHFWVLPCWVGKRQSHQPWSPRPRFLFPFLLKAAPQVCCDLLSTKSPGMPFLCRVQGSSVTPVLQCSSSSSPQVTPMWHNKKGLEDKAT